MKKVFQRVAFYLFNQKPSTKMETKTTAPTEQEQVQQPEELAKQQEISTSPEAKAEAISSYKNSGDLDAILPKSNEPSITIEEGFKEILANGGTMPEGSTLQGTAPSGEPLDFKTDGLTAAPVEEPQTDRTLTFGERLVGLNFNPSQDPKVKRAKELCAELADLVNGHFVDEPLTDDVKLKHKLFDHAIGEILNAQMTVVKVLTF